MTQRTQIGDGKDDDSLSVGGVRWWAVLPGRWQEQMEKGKGY